MAQKRINFLNRDEFLEHLNELANSVTDTQQKIEIMKMIKDLATQEERENEKSEASSVGIVSLVAELFKRIGKEIETHLKEEEESAKIWKEIGKPLKGIYIPRP